MPDVLTFPTKDGTVELDTSAGSTVWTPRLAFCALLHAGGRDDNPRRRVWFDEGHQLTYEFIALRPRTAGELALELISRRGGRNGSAGA